MFNSLLDRLTARLNRLNPVIFVAVVFEVIFVAIIVIVLINIFTPSDSTDEEGIASYNITIDNYYSATPSLPNYSPDEINFALDDLVWLNNKSWNSKTSATIRADSVVDTYYATDDIHQTYFLVDIPDLQQSYQVTYLWSKTTNNAKIPTNYHTMVYCPTSDQIIYPTQTTCTDRYAGTATNIITSWHFQD